MKVILVNGSPNRNGCTATALDAVAKSLNKEGIETESFWIGKQVAGCMACGKCAELGRCVFDDKVNEFTDMAASADGFVFGSPVYYSGMNGSLKGFMDRAFFSASSKDVNPFTLKPATSVTSARRAGTTTTVDQMIKYFMITQMPVVSSRYWNMVHGNTPEEVLEDREGIQIMEMLGRNMAWMLKSIEAGRDAGVELPEQEEIEFTNFVR